MPAAPPFPGPGGGDGVLCDDCLTIARPWARGRAALAYRDAGRRLVLMLKHGDRPDLAGPVAGWLETAGRPVLTPGTLLVPVPIHWSRLLRRRYNQSAELVRALARRTGLEFCPDALVRVRKTPVQDGLTADGRFLNVAGSMGVHPKRGRMLIGRDVCLLDDVMTSGATLAVAAEACYAAGARQVCVLVLARVGKDA